MTKLIFISAFCYLSISCNQNPNAKEGKLPVASGDTLQTKNPGVIDTTEIDAVKVSPGIFNILLENNYVRVVEYSLKPGEKDSTHTHPPKTSYVISGGLLRVYPENEKPFDAEEITGTTGWSGKRGKHYVENIGKTTVTILLTEIKSAR